MKISHFNDGVTSDAKLVNTGWEEVEGTDDSFMEEVKTYTEFKIANFVNIYWYPILVPIGLIGNTLSFLL